MTDEQFKMVFNAIENRRMVANHWLLKAEPTSEVYKRASSEADACTAIFEAVMDIKQGRNLYRYRHRTGEED
jgi:hypothetical protein